MYERPADLLIVGGGLGGCAAAAAACELGLEVVLTEPTGWLGGQLTSQAVPADEHPWIETHGCPASWRRLRAAIRAWYRQHPAIAATAAADPQLNPGGGWVSRLCSEPRAALAAIDALLAPHVRRGTLRILRHCRPVAAATDGDWVGAVTLLDETSGEWRSIIAKVIIDATETGELLALTGCEHVTGSESQAQTGEPHASTEARPGNIQAATWCLAVGYDPHGEHVIEQPPGYAIWRTMVPDLHPAWPGPLLDWTYPRPSDLSPVRAKLFEDEPGDGPALFTYRQLVSRATFGPETEEVTLLNWPQNDYLLGGDLAGARSLSLSLLYWLQTEAPRPDGGQGYPGLRPRGDVVGTEDGLALAPYHREGRRIVAELTVTENHIGRAARGGCIGAEPFPESVGLGAYRLDLHPTVEGDNYVDLDCWPFQIPLGALLPVRLTNLLAGAKNIGTTHLTNGCYRLHPVEWGIGEAAGSLAAFSLLRHEPPRAVRAKPELLADFQSLLSSRGVELAWPAAGLVAL